MGLTNKILYYCAYLLSTILRNTRYVYHYLFFKVRRIYSGNSRFLDNRYCKGGSRNIYPFIDVSEILFLGSLNQIVSVSDCTYENVRNVGMCVKDFMNEENDFDLDEFDSLQQFYQFRRFCYIPTFVHSIKCKHYPWIQKNDELLVVNNNISFDETCEKVYTLEKKE